MVRVVARQVLLPLWCCVALAGSPSDAASQAVFSETDPTPADTTLPERKKMRSRSTWEEVAYLPGRVIYFPLKCALKGVSVSIGYIDDSKLIPRMDDLLTSDDGRRGVEPTYAARTGGGILCYQKGLFGTPSDRNTLRLTLTAGNHQRQRYQFALEGIRFARELLSSNVLLGYRKLTTESFFGIGPEAPFSDRTSFTQEQASAEVSFGTSPESRLSLRALLGYSRTDIAEGRDPEHPSTTDGYTELSLPGIEQAADILHLQFALSSHSMNRPGNPTRGYQVLLSGGLHQESGGDRLGFAKYAADLAGYLHLFYDRVLVLRAAGEITDPLEGREIPFYCLSELGRRETIRGFERGRFRDRDMLLASAEYRYPVWTGREESGVDFVLFADAGQVSPDLFREALMDGLRTGFGFGLRLWDKEGLTAELEAAKSVDGWRLYFVLG